MATLDDLERFCLAHEQALLMPAEHLDDDVASGALAPRLIASGRISADQWRCLADGVALYFRHCGELFARAPGSWFPPRRLNVLVVSEAGGLLPYLDTFPGSSAMLYLSDLDTHPAYVAYLLAHIERLTQIRQVGPTVVFNLSWWLTATDEMAAAFTQAARDARRGDGATFRHVAQALPWVRQCFHDPLRAPTEAPAEPFFGVTGTGLYVPKRLQPELMSLADRAEKVIAEQMHRAQARTMAVGSARQRAVDALADWLIAQQPALALHRTDGREVWSPAQPDVTGVRKALDDASTPAVQSILADLQVVDARTRDFLGRLADPAALPTSCGVLETGGGAYVDAPRRLIVYELQQKSFDALHSAAPPYHRLLLGARVVHEWGHLAHAARLIRVPEARKDEYRIRRAKMGEAFLALLRSAPAHVQPQIETTLRPLAAWGGSEPAGLARKTLGRVGDYLSNLLASHLLPPAEMQAYVRVNVRHHMDEELDLISEIARYAYEIQYLPLAGLPRSYFYGTSFFPDTFVNTGVFAQPLVERLFDAVGDVLATYEIDAQRIELRPAAEATIAA